MAKPPTTDQELTARVTALEQRADATDAAIASLDARVTVLEELVTSTPPVEPPVDPPAAGTLRVTIDAFIFNEADGVDIGTYNDPDGRFSERCTRVTRADTPLRVDFRRMQGRTSVVVGCGYWQDTTPSNLPAYTATIEGDGISATINVPHHSSFQRWRWCSAPWPLPMRKLSDLYDAKLLPRWDPTLTRGTDPYPGSVHYEPMGTAGLYAYMPTTGGRGDIGHVTAWQGYYMCHEDNLQALADVLAQGEAGGTYTWDFCDRDTHAVIDAFEQYPHSSCYWNQGAVGTPWINMGDPNAPNGSGITIDSAHQPALSYLPYLLTGDPYYLENLQRQAVFIVTENNDAPVRSYGVLQPRGTGWSSRTLAQAAKVSPDNPPSWLLPRRLFVDGIVRWANDYFIPETVNNPANKRSVLHLVSRDMGTFGPDGTATAVQHFQEDIAMGGGAWLSFLHPTSPWPTVTKWHVQQCMARLDPQSGWSLASPAEYLMKAAPDAGMDAYASWQACWDANAPYLPPYSDKVPVPEGSNYDYWTHMSTSMSIAWQAGVTEVEPYLVRILTQLVRGCEMGGGRVMESNRAIAAPPI